MTFGVRIKTSPRYFPYPLPTDSSVRNPGTPAKNMYVHANTGIFMNRTLIAMVYTVQEQLNGTIQTLDTLYRDRLSQAMDTPSPQGAVYI